MQGEGEKIPSDSVGNHDSSLDRIGTHPGTRSESDRIGIIESRIRVEFTDEFPDEIHRVEFVERCDDEDSGEGSVDGEENETVGEGVFHACILPRRGENARGREEKSEDFYSIVQSRRRRPMMKTRKAIIRVRDPHPKDRSSPQSRTIHQSPATRLRPHSRRTNRRRWGTPVPNRRVRPPSRHA